MSLKFAKVFESFIQQRPVAVMARCVLERLLNAERIDQLFQQTAEVQYTRDLLFSSVVDLMGQVVLGVQPSVHAAYQAQAEELGVSDQAVYDKLNRIEPRISAELVRDSARQAAEVIDALDARLPPFLKGYRTKILDGNHFSATEHRIQELRTTWAAPLPGKALVVLDQETMLADHVIPCEDGHAQERSLLSQVLPCVGEGELWIADRNLSTVGFMAGIILRKSKFVFRQHGQLKGELIGSLKAKGKISTGKVYEQKMRIVDGDGTVHTLRRIKVELKEPTRDGDTELYILTNLSVQDAGAKTVAQLYARRWTIETMFQELTETLTCEVRTLGYPKAALFAFCLALLAYHAVSLLKAAMRAVHGRETVERKISAYYLSLEISQTYDGMMVAVPAPQWAVFRTLTPAEFAGFLKQWASNMTLRRYRKHPRGPKKPPPDKSAYENGGHVSTARILKMRQLKQ